MLCAAGREGPAPALGAKADAAREHEQQRWQQTRTGQLLPSDDDSDGDGPRNGQSATMGLMPPSCSDSATSGSESEGDG